MSVSSIILLLCVFYRAPLIATAQDVINRTSLINIARIDEQVVNGATMLTLYYLSYEQVELASILYLLDPYEFSVRFAE